jgi:histidine triad (HIT) family protein
MEDCIFCKIASKEIPSDLIYEDDDVFVFLDIKPVNKGHTLIIPKKHSMDLLETDDETLANLVIKAKHLAGQIMTAMGAAGFNLNINTKAAAGQAVFHTHFHIIPRYSNDGLKMWPHLEVEPKTRAEMAAELRKFLG